MWPSLLEFPLFNFLHWLTTILMEKVRCNFPSDRPFMERRTKEAGVDSKWTVGEFLMPAPICNRIAVQWVSARHVVHKFSRRLIFRATVLVFASAFVGMASPVPTCARRQSCDSTGWRQGGNPISGYVFGGRRCEGAARYDIHKIFGFFDPLPPLSAF